MYGIAYLEVIRNIAGEVVQIEFIKDTPSITKTRVLDPYISSVYYHHGEQTERKKRYCKYKQEIGGKVVYFKEFGDPRIMDRRDGLYLKEGETLDLEYQANEIMEFAIGTEPYGEVRWIGQVLGVDGSRKAESLNNNYFENGRHTPLMIMIKGGTLTDESFAKLQQYMNDIKGAAGQHAFIILETESTDGRTDFDQTEKPDIEVKDLANILQKDELFQDYLDNNRRKVQSAFQLPDLYVGYTTDFNRATAQTAQEVTEEQVFQPERKSLAWAINNRLLNGYQFKYVEVYFMEPDIGNPDDLYKLLTVCNNAGGLTPNKAKQIIYEAYGEVAEDYPEEWGDIPLNYSKTQGGGAGFDIGQLTMSLQKQIEKAAGSKDDEIVAVMKEVKKILEKDFSNAEIGSIIKGEWNEDAHPRDENGRFTSGFGGASSSDFASAVADAKATLAAKNAWRVTAHTEQELDEDYPGATLHITKGGSTVAVTSDGDIISVCGNSNDTIRGRELMNLATENGGVKLDSYSGNHGFYVKCGFEPVSWCEWDDNGADEHWINQDWLKANGLKSDISTAELSKISDSSLAVPREPVVFYKYTGNTGPYSAASLDVNNFLASTPASTDYDAAQAARDSMI